MNTITPLEQLLLNLLAIPSPSGEEHAISTYLQNTLSDFTVTTQHVVDGRENVVATKGVPQSWIVAHMDTVPGDVPIRITDNAIYGRGACDNKQSIAGAIFAGRQLDNIGLLFTVGEELDFSGAKVAQQHGVQGDIVIVQEPTAFEIITGTRGVITAIITTQGTEQHSRDGSQDSAIHALLKILADLEKEQWTAFNIGTIGGGVAGNVVAGSASATVVIRPETEEEYASIQEKLSTLPATVGMPNVYKPYRSSLPFPTRIARGFSEMTFFDNSVEFGAGDRTFAHTPEEHILRKDLHLLPQKLIELIENVQKK